MLSIHTAGAGDARKTYAAFGLHVMTSRIARRGARELHLPVAGCRLKKQSEGDTVADLRCINS